VLTFIAQAPEATGWTVTTYIAAAGAVISVATLAVTTYYAGRRETIKWAREELAKAYYDFIDATYSATHAAYVRQKTEWGVPDSPSGDQAAHDLRSAVRAVREAQTKIRLLAPGRSVELANEVRLATVALERGISRETSYDDHEKLRAAVSEKRKELIGAAKKDMSLRR
jgi:hypothetical protein